MINRMNKDKRLFTKVSKKNTLHSETENIRTNDKKLHFIKVPYISKQQKRRFNATLLRTNLLPGKCQILVFLM